MDFISVNNQWIELMSHIAQKGTPADRSYWHHVNLINLQMRGVHAGYLEGAKEAGLPPLIFESVLYMNMGDEVGDFAGARTNP